MGTNRFPVDFVQFLYGFNGYLLLQKVLYPVHGTVCYPRAGIIEGDLLGKGFVAAVAFVAMYGRITDVFL